MLNTHKKYFLNNFKNWNFNKKIKIRNLTFRNNKTNWINYKNEFHVKFMNTTQKIIIINYEKYNYNFIQYMCKIKSNVKISILDFCATIGLFIPHYCYHPDLSIAGNCRMCLVQLDGSIKPIVSCAISILPNMIINTQSLFVKKMQESVLEFLLVNHPLDCVICDTGGECDLQDLTLAYGNDRGRYLHLLDSKRSVNDTNCNPFVKFVLTRCIHCTRCIRFLNEYGGNHDMGMLGRGGNSEIVYILILF